MHRLENIEQRIKECLIAINPYLNEDGGAVEFVRYEFETQVLEVRMTGACEKCPLAIMTLRAGIERYVINAIPEIRRVERVY